MTIRFVTAAVAALAAVSCTDSTTVDRYEIIGEAPWCGIDVDDVIAPPGVQTRVDCRWLSEQHCKIGTAQLGFAAVCVPKP